MDRAHERVSNPPRPGFILFHASIKFRPTFTLAVEPRSVVKPQATPPRVTGPDWDRATSRSILLFRRGASDATLPHKTTRASFPSCPLPAFLWNPRIASAAGFSAQIYSNDPFKMWIKRTGVKHGLDSACRRQVATTPYVTARSGGGKRRSVPRSATLPLT